MKGSPTSSGITSGTETTYFFLLIGRLWLFSVVSRTSQQGLRVSLLMTCHSGREYVMSITILHWANLPGHVHSHWPPPSPALTRSLFHLPPRLILFPLLPSSGIPVVFLALTRLDFIRIPVQSHWDQFFWPPLPHLQKWINSTNTTLHRCWREDETI